jgi:streptogramin lyase
MSCGRSPGTASFAGKGVSDPIWITTGPDKALWFTNFKSNAIDRITTAGRLRIFTGPAIVGPAAALG